MVLLWCFLVIFVILKAPAFLHFHYIKKHAVVNNGSFFLMFYVPYVPRGLLVQNVNLYIHS